MKTLKTISLIVLAVVVAAGGWFLYLVYGPKTAIEDVLPSGAVAYARLAHPAVHWQGSVQSEFWKNIAAINVPQVLARNKFPKATIERFKRWQGKGDAFFKNPLVQKFLGREIAVALYPRQGADPVKNPEQAYSLLGVVRLAPSIQALEFMGGLSRQWGGQITVNDEAYKGRRLVHVTFTGKKTAIEYVRLGDLLVFAAEGDKDVRRAVDVYRKEQASLKQDENFTTVRTRAYPGAEGLAYVNVQLLRDGIKGHEQAEDSLASTVGFKAYAVSFLPGHVLKYKLIAGFEPLEMSPYLRHMVSCAPMENPSLGFIPSDVIGYQWSGCYDFKDIWQQTREELHAVPEMAAQAARMKKGLEKRMGMSFSLDLLPVLGPEAGGYLTELDTVGLFPYPRLLAFVRVTDRSRVEELLGRVVKSPLGKLRQETYDDVSIRYVGLPLGPNMDPGYCFLGDYLLASTSRQLLKKSIDTWREPGRSLKSDKNFKALGLGDAPKTQSVAFLKVGQLATRLRGLLDWGNKYFSSQVSMASMYKQEGETKKAELAHGIAAKETELKLASAKLAELKAKPSEGLSPDEQTVLSGSIANLERESQDMQDEIRTYKAEAADLQELMANYQSRAESAKLFMFNSQHILVPILKSLETVNVQGMNVMINGKILETELTFIQ